MRKILAFLTPFAISISLGCTSTPVQPQKMEPCTSKWFFAVEQQFPTADGNGHGPDFGSLEWRLAIESKLGIRDDPKVPPPESAQWCNYINSRYESVRS